MWHGGQPDTWWLPPTHVHHPPALLMCFQGAEPGSCVPPHHGGFGAHTPEPLAPEARRLPKRQPPVASLTLRVELSRRGC